jgi:type IV secretory pathway TraG/TraD family ATPase VirD4
VLLKMFDDPVLDHLSSATELSFSQLVCGDYPVSLYLSIPDDDAPRVRPYIKALIVGIRRALMKYERTDRYGELKQHRLLMCLDEYLDIKIKDMAEATTKAASYFITMLLVVQGFELMESQEADKGAGIRKNASTWVMYKPNDDIETYRIEKMLGQVTVIEENESHSSDRMSFSWSRKSVSRREVQKTILPASELLKWPKRKWAIIMGHGKPIKADVIRSHMERRFASKVIQPAPMRDFATGELGDAPSEKFVSPWLDKVGTPVVIERKPKEKKVVGERPKPKTKPVDPVKQAAEQNQMVLVGIKPTNPQPPTRVIT